MSFMKRPASNSQHQNSRLRTRKPKSMTIRPLADMPECIPTLARWFQRKWHDFDGLAFPTVEAQLSETQVAKASPITFMPRRTVRTALMRRMKLLDSLGMLLRGMLEKRKTAKGMACFKLLWSLRPKPSAHIDIRYAYRMVGVNTASSCRL
jgi:hypothetical protein